MAKDVKAKAEGEESAPVLLPPFEQLVVDLNAIVDDPEETDAPRMLRRIIERVRRR